MLDTDPEHERHRAEKMKETNTAWWLNPAGYSLWVLLPTFMVTCWIGAPMMAEFGALNYLNFRYVLLGAGVCIIIAAGAALGKRFNTSSRHNFIPSQKGMERVILVTSGISLLMHLIMLSPLITDPSHIVGIMSGAQSAVFLFKQSLISIPGITTFTQLYMFALALFGAHTAIYRIKPPKHIYVLVISLLIVIAIRAFFSAERLALVEAGLAYIVPVIILRQRRFALLSLYPILGIVALVVLFSVGEYFRAWQYYQTSYDSFALYISQRLTAYIAVASNTGAGMIETYDSLGYPYVTALWFWRLPIFAWLGVEINNPIVIFLEDYGNLEYNNPSGIFAAIVDFGAVAGYVFYFIFGVACGVSYSLIRQRSISGILLFPLFFITLLSITQYFYLGDPRAFPLLISAPMILSYLRFSSRSGTISSSLRTRHRLDALSRRKMQKL